MTGTPFGSYQRGVDGITCTLVRGDEVWVVTAGDDGSGPAAGLREIARICDARGWRIRAISTPESILRDLQGNRVRKLANDVAFPERTALGKIGRLDLLEPRETRTYADPDAHRIGSRSGLRG